MFKLRNTAKLSSLFVIGVVLASLFSCNSAVHATTAGFKAGEIIDDTVMTKANSMSVSQIQNFLNSKVSNCDTNGQQISEYGGPDLNNDGKVQRWEWGKSKYNQTKFICLKNWKSSGGTSAAQVIYNKAQAYNINPQVLIVLLQKEQGLVTDTWPLSLQYRTATGYGCPDTAPCDSQYYGLANQLDWAAKMYRAIIDQSPSWYSPYFKGSNPTVYWHPDTARCGSASLNILNWSTAGLYSYTPYRPNQASLNAGYGTGNSCSSYGNRNFYNYFTDWFGSTTAPLFKIGSGNTIYLSYSDRYYAIPSPKVLRAYGLSGKRVVTVSASQLDSYTEGPALSLLAKYGSNATVYLIDRGQAHAAPSWAMLNHYGYTSGDLVTYSDENLSNVLSAGKSISQLARRTNGAIYFVDSNKKHIFPDYATYTSEGPTLTGNSTLSPITYSDELLNPIPESSPVFMDGVSVSAKDTAAIYLHESNKLQIFSANTWKHWGRKLNHNINSVSKLSDITREGSVSLLVTNGSANYFVSNGSKYPVPSDVMTAMGIDASDFTTYSNRALNILTTGRTVTPLLRTPNGAVYSIISGKKYIVASGSDFIQLGYKWSDVTTVDYSIANLVPSGNSPLFAQGSLIRTPDGAVSIIDTDFNRHVIPSGDVFNEYGFKWKSVRNYSSSALADYSADVLEIVTRVSPTGPYMLADSGTRYSVSSVAYGASQFNLSSWPQTSVSSALRTKLVSSLNLTKYVKGSSAAVYKIENGTKRPFGSLASFYGDGGSWSQVTYLSDGIVNSIPTGAGL